MKHHTIIFQPEGREISIHSGATLVEAAGQAGIVLNTTCGGTGTCKKCMVIVEPGGEAVLACQYRVESDLTVTVPVESRFFEQKILKHGVESEIDVRPNVFRKYTAGNADKRIFGVAVDIGTTTVVAKLVDMAEGDTVSTAAMLNPQTKYGDDVISRITHGSTPEGLAELNKTIIDCINSLTSELCEQASIQPSDIYEMCIVGNTTMNHILLKLPVEQLGRAPYEAWSVDARDVEPKSLGLNMNGGGNAHTVENIAGFVGSDTVAVGLSVDIASAVEMTLVVDIGTNGELILGTKDKLYSASCAAGPALEGARIRQGGRAGAGAIEAVVISGDDIDVDVIGGGPAPARSICGSGLIDAIAVMLELGVIDGTGRFAEAGKLSGGIAARLTEIDGQPAFVLTEGDRPVAITQKDVREAQLAKAAIRAGIKLLQKKLGIEDGDIRRIYLAGAFGNYIKPGNAARIGLLPDVPVDRIRSIGNAAAIGAQMALISNQSRAAAAKLAKAIEYVEIAHEADFQDVYADCICF
ncbi:MAG: DUF4445 domain-containing protein [Sedimentisphaerales bacterium]|nr:DUF4445 domain-containing protein [Sedimentisphaerales bacterium]